jgi:ornithine carbamoyltransferase
MLPFQINESLMTGSNAIVMHDMPVHAGSEISRAVFEAHSETIFRQAENRTYAQKGLLLELLSG